MRQIDAPEGQPELGKPIRQEPAKPEPRQVSQGIQELGGRLMTDIAKNLAAPDDTPALCWSRWFY